MTKPVAIPLLLAAALLLIFEHRMIRYTRERNEALKASQLNTVGTVNALETNDALVLAELEQLRRENRGLLKLRGEITQLRNQNNHLQNLREETERLKRELMSLPQLTAQPIHEQPFVRSGQYAVVGFATPEQAVQSVLWALQHRDVPAMLRCLDPESARDFADDGDYVTEKLSSKLDHFAEAHQVISRRVVAPDEIVLRIRSSIGVEVALRLHAFAGEWKVMNFAQY